MDRHRRIWLATKAKLTAALGADLVTTVVTRAVSAVSWMLARPAYSVVGRAVRWRSAADIGALRYVAEAGLKTRADVALADPVGDGRARGSKPPESIGSSSSGPGAPNYSYSASPPSFCRLGHRTCRMLCRARIRADPAAGSTFPRSSAMCWHDVVAYRCRTIRGGPCICDAWVAPVSAARPSRLVSRETIDAYMREHLGTLWRSHGRR